jgi:hypothetical protein
MGHKCYISFKTEDFAYKYHLQTKLNIDMIDKSLDVAIDSSNEDYIMQKIREDYLSDSTVTIHLIGTHSAENLGNWEQRYIKRELQASLYNGENNPRSGILGIVLPSIEANIYKGNMTCLKCGRNSDIVCIDNTTVISEFSMNYYIPHGRCCWYEDDRYCVLVKWSNFCLLPEYFIEMAYNKRNDPIAKKVKVYGK